MALPEDDRHYTEQRVLRLDPHTRRVLLLKAVLRIVGITAALLAAYFAVPVGQDADVVGITFLVVGLAGFVVLLVYQIGRIVRSPAPQLRAAEALATAVPLVIVIFALAYVAMSDADAAAFSEPITKVNGLYFTVTVLSTVGFGDITGVTESARLLVTLQMALDLLIIGVLVKVIIGASRIGIERRRQEEQRAALVVDGGDADAGGGPPEPDGAS